MDLMDLRRRMMSLMASGKLPPFFHHVKSGSFVVESGTSQITISVGDITDPLGILVLSDVPFDLLSQKEDKPLLGAYGALYLRGSQQPNRWSIRQMISELSNYFINWGSSGDPAFPSARPSRTEVRGLRYYNTETCEIEMAGFGTGDYDFKNGIQYNWIVWD